MLLYLDDSCRFFQYPVSILRFEKGDQRQKDYAPFWHHTTAVLDGRFSYMIGRSAAKP